MLKACFGEEMNTARYTVYLVNILLESAAVNVPIAIIVAIGYGLNKEFGPIITTPMIACQVCLGNRDVR